MIVLVDIIITVVCAFLMAFGLFVAHRSRERGWVKIHAGYGATRIVHRSENPHWFSFGIWQQYLGVVFMAGIIAWRWLKYVQ